MISFRGFDPEVFHRCFQDAHKQEKQLFKKALIFCVAFFCIMILFAFITSITMSYIAVYIYIACIVLFMLLCIAFIFYRLIGIGMSEAQKNYIKKKRQMNYHYEITVEDNASYLVFERHRQIAHITHIDTMKQDVNKCELVLHGRMETSHGIQQTYPIPLALHHIDQLIPFMNFTMQQKEASQFQNTTLKSGMHLPADERKKHFLEILKDSFFLLPCTLKKDCGIPFTTHQDITVYAPYKQDAVLIFTSEAEIDKGLIEFPLRFVISFQELLSQCYENEQIPLFSSKIKNMQINTYTEDVTLEMAKIREWIQNEKEDALWQS